MDDEVTLGDDHNLQPILGLRLREIRKSRGLSLADVGRGTNISRSFLSLVETGQSELTIGRLIRLVGFYGVHVSDFLAESEAETEQDVVRVADRRYIPSPEEHMEIWLLAPQDDRSMLPMYVVFGPGGGLAEMGQHPGEEFIHVLEGDIVLQLEGREPVLLHEGDTAWYAGDHRHSLTNPGREPARIMAVMSPPNL
jgi:transcriptional regulator with XRE-family HTH domain